jgi:hypothetical protein
MHWLILSFRCIMLEYDIRDGSPPGAGDALRRII